MGRGGLSESIKKENFFKDNTDWSSKNLWKIISADVKPNKNYKK